MVRLLRRASLPLKFSEGFNPRPKVIFLPPLPLGIGAESDWCFAQLKRAPDEGELKLLMAGLVNGLPEDLAIISYHLDLDFQSPRIMEEDFLLKTSSVEPLKDFIDPFLHEKKFPYHPLDLAMLLEGGGPDLEDLMDERGRIMKVSSERENHARRVAPRDLDLKLVVREVRPTAEGVALTLDGQANARHGFPSNGKWVRCLGHLFQKNSGPTPAEVEIVRTRLNLN